MEMIKTYPKCNATFTMVREHKTIYNVYRVAQTGKYTYVTDAKANTKVFLNDTAVINKEGK